MKRLFHQLGLIGCLVVFLNLIGCSKDPVSPEKQDKYTVDVTASNGEVKLSPAGGSYTDGTIVTLTATADDGYTFSKWSGDLTGTDNPFKISVTSDLDITALFTKKNTDLPTDPESLTTIKGVITSDTTWNSDVTIDGALNIQGNVVWSRKIKVNAKQNAVVTISKGGSLTIQEGVVVTLSTGSYIQSGYNSSATLVAEGTDSLPITFTKDATVQSWGNSGGAGILVSSHSTSSTSLNYCIIEHATGGIYIDGITPVITNCIIRNNAGYGIYFNGQAMPKDSASFVNNSITGNGKYPISISSEGITNLSGDTHMDDNTSEGIEVRGGNVTKSGTWKLHNQPYNFTGNTSTKIQASAGVAITVDPGVICKFDNANYIEVGYSDPGTFIASGNDTLPIVFTRIEGIENWGHTSGGILISSNATNNSAFNCCIIEYATSGLRIQNSSIVINNCKIRNNANYGVYFENESGPKDTVSFIKDSITDNGGYPLSIHADKVINLSGETYFSGNAKPLIEVRSGSVEKSGKWRKHMIPYFFNGETSIGSEAGVTITVNPGAVLMFDQNAYLEIGYNNTASFIANGTETDSIRFISGATAAYWGHDNSSDGSGGLWFGSSATGNSSLQYCVIDSATTGIYVIDATLAISNCRITNNQQNGITFDYASPKDSAGFLNNVITKNGAYGITIRASKLGNLSGTGSVAGNTLGGIFVEGDYVESSATWKKHDAPYIVKGTVAIGSDKGAPAVTIMPGAKFELLQEAYFEIGYSNAGALIANGTATDSIVFTSHNDGVFWGYSGDNAGGLWVGDGAATTTSFTYCIIEKATAGVYLDMAATVKNCTIRNNEGFGIVIADEGTDANVSDNVYLDNGSGDVSQYE